MYVAFFPSFYFLLPFVVNKDVHKCTGCGKNGLYKVQFLHHNIHNTHACVMSDQGVYNVQLNIANRSLPCTRTAIL